MIINIISKLSVSGREGGVEPLILKIVLVFIGLS